MASTIKKTIYISEKANQWLESQVNQSATIDKLILSEIKNDKEFVSKDEVIKLIQEYVKAIPGDIQEVKQEQVSNKVKVAAGSLLKL